MKMTEKNVELIKEALQHECPCNDCYKKYECNTCCNAKSEWASKYIYPLDNNHLTYLWSMLVELQKMYSDFDRLIDSIAVEIEETELIRVSQFLYTVKVRDLDESL